ncbi:MAG: helix-turn-helix transcriptional regulator [Saprospiraceae bacterium]|nr:helix-turn-helix transcriptional regulator [Saprospiraceae bacterium]|tara:strand:- start:929 stop:1156 length:228 start_codon:yes stop_codon:yes gene_type:complete
MKQGNRISQREQEVLHLVAYELTTKEIAAKLFISNHTVISHRKNLIEKLNVKNTAGLIRRAFELGILSISTGYSS